MLPRTMGGLRRACGSLWRAVPRGGGGGISLETAAEVAAAAAAGGTAAAVCSGGGATTTRRALAVAGARIGPFNVGTRALRVGGGSGSGYPAAAAAATIPTLASGPWGYRTDGPPRRSGGGGGGGGGGGRGGGGPVVDLTDVNACPPGQLLDFIQTYHGVFDAGAAASAVHKINNRAMDIERVIAHPAIGLLLHTVVHHAPTMSPNQVVPCRCAG